MNVRDVSFSNAASTGALAARFAQVRARTLALAAPLSEEDCCVQSMADASPVKWHLAHTTWFFETFVLEKYEERFRAFHPAFRVLFNSYYNGVGDKHPRPQRGMLTRPPLSLVMDYRANVSQRMAHAITQHGKNAEFRNLVLLGINHEEQHQELIVTDVKHLLSLNPLAPAYLEPGAAQASAHSTSHQRPHAPKPTASALTWHRFQGGLIDVGATPQTEFCFDNELPRHQSYVAPFQLASRLATNGEFLAFIEAGGYQTAQLWLSEGWDWVRAQGVDHPVYWSKEDAGWHEFTLSGRVALDAAIPVSHLSYFEADAYEIGRAHV